VEWLKVKALSSSLSTAKKKKKKCRSVFPTFPVHMKGCRGEKTAVVGRRTSSQANHFWGREGGQKEGD
jgi:hypothetical protein